MYGIYKNSRNAAWQCLIDFKITSLPVKLSDIAKQCNISIFKNSNINILEDNQSGISFLQNGKFYIIYNDNDSVQRNRFTIAHELGHIFLGHLLIDTKKYRTFDYNNFTESAANIFARDILSPACVLHELGIIKPDEIAKLCNISYSSAKIRSERMQILEKRNKWYTHPLEREVFNLFENFIQKKKLEL